MLGTSLLLLVRFSAKSADEVARTLDPATAFLEELWFLDEDEVSGLSWFSWFNKKHKSQTSSGYQTAKKRDVYDE